MIGVVIADEQCSPLRWFDGNFPMAAHNLTLRAKRYNDSVAYAKQLAAEGRVLILAPDDITGIDTTKHSKESVMRMYGKGFRDANAIADFLK